MVFYMNTDNGDTTSIKVKKPEEDRAVLLATDFKFMQEYDFYNFNYFVFEQDVIDMANSEFEWWYETTFEPWLIGLDERYLDIDYDNLGGKFESQAEKRLFMLKIINFVMFLLPYEIMRKVFTSIGIGDNYDAAEFLRDEENLIFLREEILEKIDHNSVQVDSFVETLRHFEKIAKKNLVEENIALLDDHIQKQNFFLEVFKRIIQETDMYKLRDLIIRMLENDSRNIL